MERYRSSDAQANHLYVLGRGLCISRRAENLDRGIEYLEQAVARDPATRCCTPRLRTATRSRPCSRTSRRCRSMPVRDEAATRALALDPDLADAHATLGHLKWRFEFDWAGAEAEYLRAIALDAAGMPRRITGSRCCAASAAGSTRRLAEMEIARQLEPALGAGGGQPCLVAGARGAVRGRRGRGAACDRDRPGLRALAQRARPRTAGTGTLRRGARGISRAARAPGPGSYADVAVALAVRGSSRRGAAGARPTARAFATALRARVRHRNRPRVRSVTQETALDWLDKAVEERATHAGDRRGSCACVAARRSRASRPSSSASVCRMPPEPGSGSRPQVPSGARVQ